MRKIIVVMLVGVVVMLASCSSTTTPTTGDGPDGSLPATSQAPDTSEAPATTEAPESPTTAAPDTAEDEGLGDDPIGLVYTFMSGTSVTIAVSAANRDIALGPKKGSIAVQV